MVTQPVRQRFRSHTGPLLLLLLSSLAAILPLILRGPSCGHDFDFHLLSWIETATDWRHGLLYPHWLVSANYGAGEPRFIFYPPISWFLGAALGAITSTLASQHGHASMGWTAAPILLIFVSIFFSGCAVYALAGDFVGKQAATIAACLFVANPYLLFVAYERAAYAELLSTAFIAVLLLLALRPSIAITPLAITIAALWLTNAPAAVMGCYTLAFIAALRTVIERNFAPAWRSAVGCALGTALAGFYLVPAAWEQRWVQIERAVSEGMRIEDSFLFEHTGQAYHDVVLHTASLLTTILVSLGLLSIVTAWLTTATKKCHPERSVVLQNCHPERSAAKSKDLHFAGDSRMSAIVILAALLVALFFLQLRVSDPLWRALPRMLFLQFPWRWLVVISIIVATLIALALDQTKLPRVASLAAALTIAASIWACAHSFYQPCDADDSVPGQLAIFHSSAGVEGTDEYTARNADNSEVLQDMPQVRVLTSIDAELPAPNAGDNPEWASDFYFPTTAKATTTVTEWDPQHRRVQIDAAQPAFAILTLMDYPAWQVTLNGALETDHGHREDGLIALEIPAGRSTIEVRWKTTPDLIWGRALSALAALTLLAPWFIEKKYRSARV